MDLGAMIPMVVIPSVCLLVGWLGWLVLRADTERARVQATLCQNLLQRFATSGEFTSFLQTESGKLFMDTIWKSSLNYPLTHILRAVQRGIVLLIFGLGILLISFMRHGQASMFFFWVGALAAALGVGQLASAALTRTLARRMGLSPEISNRPVGVPRDVAG